ncbi:MAG: hypothetical protein ACK50J_22995 [Planctomyces sp.]
MIRLIQAKLDSAMFQESQEKRKLAKAAIREGEAPAEPSSRTTLIGRSGSAGASPSLQGVVNDILRTGLPHSLTDDEVTMELVHNFVGTSLLLVIISCVFNTKYGAVQLERVTKPGLASAESLKRLRKVTFKGACPGFVRAS